MHQGYCYGADGSAILSSKVTGWCGVAFSIFSTPSSLRSFPEGEPLLISMMSSWEAIKIYSYLCLSSFSFSSQAPLNIRSITSTSQAIVMETKRMEKSLGFSSRLSMNLRISVPLQMISAKRTRRQKNRRGRSPLGLQSTEQFRLVRTITTEQRQQPVQSIMMLRLELVTDSTSCWQPKMLNSRITTRMTIDHGIKNLICDSTNKVFRPSSSQERREIVMMALVASVPRAMPSNPLEESPSQLYQAKSSQSLPRRQRTIVIVRSTEWITVGILQTIMESLFEF